ncbi:extracellular solute-binding protein [Dongia sp.]|uniref:extracellular solute-binding protein n=1 Tax=Dongia sp. TaxID=1977262 RepID=UPI0035B204C1
MSKSYRSRLVQAIVGGGILAGAQSFGFGALADTTLNALFMAQAAYSEDNVRAMTADFEAANPGVKINLEFVPYEGLHDKTTLAQGAGSGYDVVLFDVIWPAEFAENKVLVDVTDKITTEMKDGVLPGAWTTVEYQGKRYGMPWILDTKYLFYNTDILEKAGIAAPPKTWAELLEQAKVIKDKKLAEYPIVWSWAQAEAAICDYTTLVAAFGGSFLDADGKPAFQSGGGVDALKYMTDSLEQGLTNPNSKEYLEEDVRRVFSSGEAAFALNWTYMFNMANDPKESKIVGKVGVVPAPGVEGKSKASAVNGSMGLGVTSTSQHPDDAWKYIVFMTSKAEQEKFAKLSLPIWADSYSQPAVTAGQEALVAAAETSLGVMFPRPTTPTYQQLSTQLQQAVHAALLKQSTPEDALKAAADSAGGGL